MPSSSGNKTTGSAGTGASKTDASTNQASSQALTKLGPVGNLQQSNQSEGSEASGREVMDTYWNFLTGLQAGLKEPPTQSKGGSQGGGQSSDKSSGA